MTVDQSRGSADCDGRVSESACGRFSCVEKKMLNECQNGTDVKLMRYTD